MACGTMSVMQKFVAFFLLCLLVGSSIPATQETEMENTSSKPTSARATGVDVTVTDVSFSYTNAGDEEKYRMFSSNYPVPGFNRPAMLYVVDTVVDIPIQVDVMIENIGTSTSGTIDVNIKVLHNEYTLFEMINETVQLGALSGGNSNSISKTFTPTYAGNHTLIIRATSTVLDDNTQNDVRAGSLTVASSYFNCDSLIGWTAGIQWGISTDTGLSMGSSCHVGNGQSSTYTNNLATALVTPVMDMSDAVSNPTRTNGLSFFYTGSAAAGDALKIQVLTGMGSWFDLGSISTTIDQNFSDGQDYQTFSISNGGATSPLIPIPQEHFHSQTQFRFMFESDASLNDIGYYFDDLVFVYDQKVRQDEYALSSNGISTVGSVPGQWGTVRVEITNDGNISDSVLPEILGLPAGWSTYFAHPSGVSINIQSGVFLAPGESKFIDVKIQPDQNATTGLQQMTFKGISSQYTEVNTTLPMQYQVLADREPYIVKPESAPSCPPGNTCSFSVEIQNLGDATDVFDLTIDTPTLPSSWDVNLAWTQESSVLVRTDSPEEVEFTLTIPNDAIPDSMFSFSLTAVSQNNSIRSHTQSIDVSASMISNATIEISAYQMNKDTTVDAGETFSIEFTIWNNASRQDIFSVSLLHDPPGQWIIEQPTLDNAVINSESSTSFTIDITAPSTGQAGDNAPAITPVITSKRSGMVFQGTPYDGIVVSTVSDLELRLIESPQKLTPGVPTLVLLEIENNGNGQVAATLTSETIPETWDWWIRINDTPDISPWENHTGVIELSAPYDSEDVVEIEVWILLPSTEKAGEIHSIGFSVENSDGLEDLQVDDNSISFDSITASVRKPELQANQSETTASVGGTASVNITVKNIGNAVDDRFTVMASVSTSPPNPDIMAFLSIGTSGASRPFNEANIFTMAAGQEMLLVVDIMIPKDMALNTRIVVSFDVIAGEDFESRPYELNHETLILVDKQRMMEAEMTLQSEQTFTTGMPAPFWINVSSSSTQAETYLITVDQPEQWQTVCQGILVNQSGQQLEHAAGHLNLEYTDMMCELHRLGGDTKGEVRITIETVDGVLSWTDSRSFNFTSVESEGFGMSLELMATSIAGVLFIAVLMALLLRKRRDDPESGEPDNFASLNEDIPSGPPVSSNGPPVSNAAEIISEPHTEQSTPPVQAGPEVPAEGLPHGWTMEQWQYYGQQYLDTKK